MGRLPFGRACALRLAAALFLPRTRPHPRRQLFLRFESRCLRATSAIICSAEPTLKLGTPPLVAPRPDAVEVGPRPPVPIGRFGLPSTSTPPAPSSATDGKFQAVARR